MATTIPTIDEAVTFKDLVVTYARNMQKLEKKYLDGVDELNELFTKRKNELHRADLNETEEILIKIESESESEESSEGDDVESEQSDISKDVYEKNNAFGDEKNSKTESQTDEMNENDHVKTKKNEQQIDDKRFKCNECEYFTKYKWDLKRHLRTHSGEKPFSCEYDGCNKRFNQMSALNVHMKYHLGQKNHKCSHCSKAFVTNSSLKKHIRTHTGEKPFECEHCNKAFKQKAHLNTHMKRHIGQKDHKCSYCSKSFVTSGNLKNHIRVHTGERPYECKHCKKRFKIKQHLDSHIKRKHNQTMTQWVPKQQNKKQPFSFKYELIKGDLFTSPESSCLCHCVSRDLGMGKGIAVLFKKKFGGLNALKKQKANIGECAILMRQNRFIYYLITKERYFHKPTYETMTASIQYMKNHAVINNVSHISMPKIGCGLDRLQWNKVEKIIQNEFKNTNVKITVYEYQQ